MDISVIRAKAGRKEYKNKTQFMDDFNLIVENCVKYNGPTSGKWKISTPQLTTPLLARMGCLAYISQCILGTSKNMYSERYG